MLVRAGLAERTDFKRRIERLQNDARIADRAAAGALLPDDRRKPPLFRQ